MDHPGGQPDLIIFDCDGVLVDSEVLSCRCLTEVLARHGIALTLDQALDLFLGRSISAVLQHYAALNRPISGDFPGDLKRLVRETFQVSLKSVPGVDAVASSSDLDRVSFSLALTGLAPFFNGHLYTSEMVARGKPAPDLFLHAADRMHAAPARTLVIEDSVSGVMAAKAAGMTVWGFTGGSHYRIRDGRGPLQAAGADRIFDSMQDIWIKQ
jgi:beta-phosphoglucomutase-like phosphatase (HAD superfamily)